MNLDLRGVFLIKLHKCEGCGVEIQKEQRCFCYVICDNLVFKSYYYCQECMAIMAPKMEGG